MKKALFIAVFAILASFSFGNFAHAQTFSAEQQTSLDSLKQAIINLLTQEIAALQAQIQTILANQATQQAQLDVVSQPTPVLGSVTPSVTTSISNQSCRTLSPKASFSITLSGATPNLTSGLGWKSDLAFSDFPRANNLPDMTKTQNVARSLGVDQTGNFNLPDDLNSTTISGSISTNRGDVPISQTLFITKCN